MEHNQDDKKEKVGEDVNRMKDQFNTSNVSSSSLPPSISETLDDTKGLTKANLKKIKGATYPSSSFNLPRRPLITPESFNQNNRLYRRVSAGTAPATTQINIKDVLVEPSQKISNNVPSTDFKENRKVSAELRRQLEGFIVSPPQIRSPSPESLQAPERIQSSQWSVQESTIGLGPILPTQVVTTSSWETEASVSPPYTPQAAYESKYFSFPPFETFPKTPRPYLGKRCSDRSWLLLQQLKGKIVEMHNSGLRSGRASSKTSMSSRNSSQPPSTALQPQSDSSQAPKRRASGKSKNRRSLQTSKKNDLNNVVDNKEPAAAVISSSDKEQSIPREGQSNTNSGDGTASPQPANTSIGDLAHINAREPYTKPQVSDTAKSNIGNPGFLEATQNVASTFFQSLMSITTGTLADSILEKRKPSITSSLGVGNTKSTRSQALIRQSGEHGSPDSSDDDMTFLEYVKRFSDSSPPPTRQVYPFASPPSGETSLMDAKSRSSKKGKEANIRTVTFREPTLSPKPNLAPNPTPASSIDATEILVPEITPNEIEDKMVLYCVEDYDTITTYFYNTQERLVRQKWPFLHNEEIQYLLDKKWLEMEWEDLEAWAEDSAKHLEDIDYVEPDLFDDIDIVDPRLLTRCDKIGDDTKEKLQ